MKTCRVCKIEMELTHFNKNSRNKDNLNNMCRGCGKKYAKNYREKNYDSVIEKERDYTAKNKIIKSDYYKNNKDKILKYQKDYRTNNKEKVNKAIIKSKNKRYYSDPTYRLKENIRSNINYSFKRDGYTKKSRTHEILGCSYDEFKIYIESQFEDWMSWDNYGNPKDGILEPNKTWDMDHIIPTSSAINESEVIKLNHFTNLQPLCSYINRIIKKDNIN